MTGRAILIVEDEFLIADHLAGMITDMGDTVCGMADTADEAVVLALRHLPDAVLMDVRLKGTADGVSAAGAIHARVGCPIIYVTGSRDDATVTRIGQDHPAAVLFKPVRFEQLRRTVEEVLS